MRTRPMFSWFKPPVPRDGPKFSWFKPPVPRDGPKFSWFKPPVPQDGPYRVIGVGYDHLDILSSRGKRYTVRIDGFEPRARPDTEDLDDLMIAVRTRDAIARWVLPGAFQKTGSAYSTERIRTKLNLTPVVTKVEWVSATEPYSARFVGANGVTLTQALVSAGYGSAA